MGVTLQQPKPPWVSCLPKRKCRIVFVECKLAPMGTTKFANRYLTSLLVLIQVLNFACTGPGSPRVSEPPTIIITPLQQTKTSSIRSPNLSELMPMDGESALITRVIDGDTVEVAIEGKSQTVRYIGIDTPETKHPSKGIECFGPEASEFNKELVSGMGVVLEKDTTDKDRYGRLLRYVWVEGRGLINVILVENGYARVSTYPPDVKYEKILVVAESLARANKIGLWSVCGESSNSNVDKPSFPPAGQIGTKCSPYYPTLCIPPFPPDLDCRDVQGVNFKVVSPDPHSLDRNRNGIGCER